MRGPHIALKNVISIHAPLAGRDEARCLGWYPLPEFQSTRPLRGATEVDNG